MNMAHATLSHALQLRQAKLSFPQVHLMVGVCSDVLCAQHKSAPAMTHAERCEAVRHCRWADEVIPDAPWVVDQAFLDKYQIDYIAHDEEVYPSKYHEDVYAFAKKEGESNPAAPSYMLSLTYCKAASFPRVEHLPFQHPTFSNVLSEATEMVSSIRNSKRTVTPNCWRRMSIGTLAHQWRGEKRGRRRITTKRKSDTKKRECFLTFSVRLHLGA